ncbi:MAG TPA: hypothetical protein PKK06_01160 [Phycisphaerae bacterium]|nr:hypothetical protein [Phycisphaerae bacterium]HNU43783.1 hypothetical protein [Phycisphaerae bacterium]
MPTPDRSTIKTAVEALLALLREHLVAVPPTAAAPFRGVAEGPAKGTEYPRPFLAVRLTRARPIGVTNDDKLFEVSAGLQVIVDLLGNGAHGGLLDPVAAVEDYLDALRDTGVTDGVDGFDERAWAFSYPLTTAGARVAIAEASFAFVVKVQREHHRVPAS